MHLRTSALISQRPSPSFRFILQSPYTLPALSAGSCRAPRSRFTIRCRLRSDHELPSPTPVILEQPHQSMEQLEFKQKWNLKGTLKFALMCGVLLCSQLCSPPRLLAANRNEPAEAVVESMEERIATRTKSLSEKVKSSSEENNKKADVITKKIKRRLELEAPIKERQHARRMAKKKGRKTNPMASFVPNPSDVPTDPTAPEVKEVMSLWRLDKMRELTYTQFWQLVRDGHVERVKFNKDCRALRVWLKDSAPGGARMEKIGIPQDPELYNFLLCHNVFIEMEKTSLGESLLFMVIRLAFPVAICYCLVQFSFRIGQKDSDDDVFGGANLDMMEAKESHITFDDIAGIDQIKDEIKEIIAFLKNPKRFTEMGARSPAGILLVGPPGTGKTLLAKAIAGESKVPFFSTAGTEFTEIYVGVGAAKVRDMFQRTREAAPCILFIDEFDGIGQRRSSDGSDESVHTINQLLTEMDGFEDNTGVIVVAATNRPHALDTALTRPGRFDRVIHLPFPNVPGRVEILKVHARDKIVAKEVSYSRVARATAGFTGAQLMNLMNQSAIVAVSHRRSVITETDIFEALEQLLMEKKGQDLMSHAYDEDIVPDQLRKQIAIYEAGKVLIGLMSPDYDEVYKVSVCPGGIPTGSTFFLPREDRLESRVITRGYMESKMVVCLAGRCTERMVLGDANISTAGAADLNRANAVAKEMVYRCGFSKRLGPVALMDSEDARTVARRRTPPIANISTDIARIAFEECRELLDAAEAKAYYGLAMNFRAIETIMQQLLEKETIGLEDLKQIADKHRITTFDSSYVEGFGWDDDGNLIYPRSAQKLPKLETNGLFDFAKRKGMKEWWDPANPYRLRSDLEEVLKSKFRKGAQEDSYYNN